MNHMLSIALKEWNLVIQALLRPEAGQAILLRKGGILEANNEFELEYPRFLLFPTFIHQDPEGLKPPYRAGLQQVRQEPDTIPLVGWAEVVHIWSVPGRPQMDRLDDLHIWTSKLLDMRFHYRPEKPLYLLLLRAFQLPEPIRLPNILDYAGCKSWVPLAREIPLDNSRPILPDDRLAALRDRIDATFIR